MRTWSQPSTRKSGLIIPDEAKANSAYSAMRGRVLALGPDAYSYKPEFPSGPLCALGDWIMFNKYAGHMFSIEGEDVVYRFIMDLDVMAVVGDPDVIKSAV